MMNLTNTSALYDEVYEYCVGIGEIFSNVGTHVYYELIHCDIKSEDWYIVGLYVFQVLPQRSLGPLYWATFRYW